MQNIEARNFDNKKNDASGTDYDKFTADFDI